jgi:Zn-dependent peptidase ImmA (M78 family)
MPPSPKSFPSLPTTIEAPGGTIAIILKPTLRHPDGTECWGMFDLANRTIEIATTATKRHQWRTLYHELAHAALDDSGISQGMTDTMQETLCECIATARMRERFG